VIQGPGYNWTVLFDARQADSPLFIFPLAGVFFVAIGVVMVRRKRFARDDQGETIQYRGSPKARTFLLIAVAWTLITGLLALRAQSRLEHALRSGQYHTIQSEVENFRAADLLRKRPETWTVAGRQYEFSYSALRSGLSTPGVVRPGMYVRIADVDGAIARLEVAR
jgi:hypothetical protein